MVVNAVGYRLRAAWHHADLAVTWGKLWVKLRTTPPAASPTRTSQLARQIEDTVLWRPADDSPLEGSPEQVRVQQGRAEPGAAGAAMADRYLFVTGKLAAPALRGDAASAPKLPFDYDVAVMKITVAALMTTDWIARRLEVRPDVTRIMIPGSCQGDVDGARGALRRSRPRRAPPTSSACRRSSARPTRARVTARATSASSPRSTTSRTSTASGSSRRRATTATPAPT